MYVPLTSCNQECQLNANLMCEGNELTYTVIWGPEKEKASWIFCKGILNFSVYEISLKSALFSERNTPLHNDLYNTIEKRIFGNNTCF